MLPHLHQLKYGIQPVIGSAGESFFVIKVSKEAILAARINNGLKVYLFAAADGPASHLGIVTAFPDDHDEPTIVATTLFDGDDLLRDVRTVLSQPQFKLYLFDEHDRELMGVWVRHPDVERFRREIGSATFAIRPEHVRRVGEPPVSAVRHSQCDGRRGCLHAKLRRSTLSPTTPP